MQIFDNSNNPLQLIPDNNSFVIILKCFIFQLVGNAFRTFCAIYA